MILCLVSVICFILQTSCPRAAFWRWEALQTYSIGPPTWPVICELSAPSSSPWTFAERRSGCESHHVRLFSWGLIDLLTVIPVYIEVAVGVDNQTTLPQQRVS